jgi:hypothetical protein
MIKVTVSNASVVFDKDTWAAIVTTNNFKELNGNQEVFTSENLASCRDKRLGCKCTLLITQKFTDGIKKALLCDNFSVIKIQKKLEGNHPSIHRSN